MIDGLMCWACGDRGCPECKPCEIKVNIATQTQAEYDLVIAISALEEIRDLIYPYLSGPMKEQAWRAVVAHELAIRALKDIERN